MNFAHLAYIVILAVAWTWGISQFAYAVRFGRGWPPTWRMVAAVWMVAKAVFLTYIGYFLWHDMAGHEVMAGMFAGIHLYAFVMWLRQPAPARPVAEPPMRVHVGTKKGAGMDA